MLLQLALHFRFIRFALLSTSLAAILPCAAFGQSGGAPVGARLPNGRLIAPEGEWLPLAPFPFALAIRPGGSQIVIPSVGWPFSLNIVDQPGTPSVRLTQLPRGGKNTPGVEVHAGVAYSPDGLRLYDATGDSGAVDVLSTGTWRRISRIALDGITAGVKYSDSFAGALALSPDGRFLYVLDQGNWRVVVVDAATGARVASVPTGANPFALAVSPDSQRLYVTNSGLFEYKLIEGAKEDDVLHTGLRFPPFGYPSRQARRGVRAEGRMVPGLGDENDPRGSSLWTYDIAVPSRPAVLARLRLGESIRSTPHGAVGGASPSGIWADAGHVYIALAHEDKVAVVSPDGRKLQDGISLTPFSGPSFQDSARRPLRGVMPVGICGNATRLFVTEAGINAVAVIDKTAGKVLGHVPVGWYPAAAALSPDGSELYVVNSKGKGAGPNGGSTAPPGADGAYIGELEFGSLSTIALGSIEARLDQTTTAVLSANKAALVEGSVLPRIKHVFFIIRENRTFDEVLGDLPGANGEPKLARFGLHGWTEEKPLLTGVRVTPNAHALAARFATSDSFYVDGDVSADGHRWALGAAPTPWMDLAWTSGYGGRRRGNSFSRAPGRRAFTGGSDGPMPEDEPEFGLLWEHIADSGLSLRNYGEGLEIEGGDELDGTFPEGQRLVLNAPVPNPVFLSTDRSFPTFNLGIPDQLRYQEFTKDFGARVEKGAAPALTVIRLPNDHTGDPRPADGYPYHASFIADNDLALGRIVEWISHSAIWKDSAIFVIEDDAQSGLDHVDAHRSVLLAISPYIKKGFISHRHCSMPSVQKTIYELLGVGSLNLEDALAADLANMFTDVPDASPFTAEASDPRIFDPALAKIARPKTKAQARKLLDYDDAKEIQSEFRKKPRRSQAGE